MKIGVLCNVSGSESLRVLKNMKIFSEKKNTDDTALTLYFCTKDEDLWDIAKKYNTTKDAIQAENSISGDVTEKDDMILIPWVG